MRETSRSLDTMYYDYDAIIIIIIIIIFITIHTTVKVIKYTDIRNFIDDASPAEEADVKISEWKFTSRVNVNLSVAFLPVKNIRINYARIAFSYFDQILYNILECSLASVSLNCLSIWFVILLSEFQFTTFKKIKLRRAIYRTRYKFILN